MSESSFEPDQQPETPLDQGFSFPQGDASDQVDVMPQLSSLTSLSQSARMKQLKSARMILIFVGVVTVALNGFLFVQAEAMVDNEIRNLQMQGIVIEGDVNQIRDQTVKMTRLIHGGTVALGVVFILLGVAVKSFPVPATVLGLVLYLGSIAVFAVINPASLLQGLILPCDMKIIFIYCLFKAVHSAIGYQRYEQEQMRTGNLEVAGDEV
tara:strand:- start:1552 stop:2181 length:630 start_codon:yes stop_codon:yes gene_type:complete